MGLVGRILQLVLFWLLAGGATAASQAKEGCLDRCGNLTIPYPFGMSESCYLNHNFLITCNRSVTPHQPQLIKGNLVVTDIRLEGRLEILQYVAKDCYDVNGASVNKSGSTLRAAMFTVSNTENKFVAVGCDTSAMVKAKRADSPDVYFYTGCMSYCTKNDARLFNDSCSGIGCCQVSIPGGFKNVSILLDSYNNHSFVKDFNPCSYAFIVKKNGFNFSDRSFDELAGKQFLPMVLDWAIGNEPCKVATGRDDYACTGNSSCHDHENMSGYICKCKDGFQGNPYHPTGCQDINECENSNHTCISEMHCDNKPGYYTCFCPIGYHGDGTKNGSRCIANQAEVICPKGYHWDGTKNGSGCTENQAKVIMISTVMGTCVLVVLVGGSWLFLIHKKRKLLIMKRRFFKQNGGLMLQQELHKRHGSTDETTRIFSADELKNATKNYDENQIVGTGGFGTVYKGILKNGIEVAIKKSKIVDRSQIDQFINEVIILSQINHRNVVKLLGCCLETEVPLLVYEFVSNGTLADHIHTENNDFPPISWEIRLRVATEAAQVLSYLHSAAYIPIIHRDVKPTNILLDHNYTAKVSDFGASRLVPEDQTQLSTMVQGTLGYLDPEYLHTNQLTEKSDVYSFGVVLVELLTSKKALSFERPEKERSLVYLFIQSLKEDRLFQILDNQVKQGGDVEQIKEVAELAKWCLRVKGEERPTMKEVATELERLRVMSQHPWVKVEVNSEETEFLLDGSAIELASIGDTSSSANYHSSISNQRFTMGNGR